MSINTWSNNNMNYLDKKHNLRIKELLKEIEENIDSNTVNLEEIEKELNFVNEENLEKVLERILIKINNSNEWIQNKITAYNNIDIDSSEFQENFNKLNKENSVEITDKIYESVHKHATNNEPASMQGFKEQINDSLPQPSAIRGINIQLFKEVFGLREFINQPYDSIGWHKMLENYLQVIKIPVDTSYKSFEFGLAFKQNIYNISADYYQIQKIHRNFSGKFILTNTTNDNQMECKMIIYNADVDPGSNQSESINPSFEFTAIKDKKYVYIFCSRVNLFKLIGLYLENEASNIQLKDSYVGLDSKEITLGNNHGFHRNIEVKDKRFITVKDQKKWFEPVNMSKLVVEDSKFNLFNKNKIKAYKLDKEYLKLFPEHTAAIENDKKYFINFISDVYNVFDLSKELVEKYHPVFLNLSTGTGELTNDKIDIQVNDVYPKSKLNTEIDEKLIVNTLLDTKFGSEEVKFSNIDTSIIVKDNMSLTSENDLYINEPSPFLLRRKEDNSFEFDLIKNKLNHPTDPINRIYKYNIVKTLSNEFYYKEEIISMLDGLSDEIDHSVNVKFLSSYTAVLDEEIKMLHLKVKTDTRLNNSGDVLSEVKELTKYLPQVPSEIIRIDDSIFIYFVKSEIEDIYKKITGDRYLDYKFNELELQNVVFEDGRRVDLTDHPEYTNLYNYYKANNYITDTNEPPELFLNVLTQDFEFIIDQEKTIEIDTNGVELTVESAVADKISIEILSNKEIKIKALDFTLDPFEVKISTKDRLDNIKEAIINIKVNEKPLTEISFNQPELYLFNNNSRILSFESNAEDLEFSVNKENVLNIEKLNNKTVKITSIAENETCSLIVKGLAAYSIEHSISIPIHISSGIIIKTPEIIDDQTELPIQSENIFNIFTNDPNYTVSTINERILVKKIDEHSFSVTTSTIEENFDIDIIAYSNIIPEEGERESLLKKIRVSSKKVTNIDLQLEEVKIIVERDTEVEVITNAPEISVASDNTDIATVEVIPGTKKFKVTGIGIGNCNVFIKATAEDRLENIKKLPIIIEDKPETKLLATTLDTEIYIEDTLNIGIVTTAEDFTVETASTEFLEINKTLDGITIIGRGVGELSIIVKATAVGCKEAIREIKVKVKDYETLLSTDIETVEDLIDVTTEIKVFTNANVFSVTVEDEEVASVLNKINSFTVRGLKKGQTNVIVSATANKAPEKSIIIPIIVYEEVTTLECNYKFIITETREPVYLEITTDADDFIMEIPDAIKDKIIYNHAERKIFTLKPFKNAELKLQAKHPEKKINHLTIPFDVFAEPSNLTDAELKTRIDELQNLYHELCHNEGRVLHYNATIDDITSKFSIIKDTDTSLIYDLSKEYYEKLTDTRELQPTKLEVYPDAFIISSDPKSHNSQIITITTDAEDYEFTIQRPDYISFDKETSTVTGLKEGWGIINIIAKAGENRARTDKQIYVKVVEDCPAEAANRRYTEEDKIGDPVEFNIKPISPTVEVGSTVVFDITGDSLDEMISESLDTSIFTVNNKEITGVAPGTAKLKITAKKTDRTDTIKEFTVNVIPAPEPPTDEI